MSLKNLWEWKDNYSTIFNANYDPVEGESKVRIEFDVSVIEIQR